MCVVFQLPNEQRGWLWGIELNNVYKLCVKYKIHAKMKVLLLSRFYEYSSL